MQARKVDPDIRSEAEVIEQPSRLKKRYWLAPLIAIIALFAIYKGWQYIAYSRSHVSTDNAFLSADITQVSPQVSGTIQSLAVQPNHEVKAGDLLVVLDDQTYRAAVDQAKANLTAAIAAKQAADADVALAERTSSGQLIQAKGGVTQAQSGVSQARADLANAEAAIQAAKASRSGATAQVAGAQTGVLTAVQNRARAIQAVASAKAQVVSAEAAVKAAEAGVKAAQAHQTYASSQASRMQALAAQGAVSKQQAEAAQQDLDTANAALQSAEDQVSSARAALADRQAGLQSARQGIDLAQSAIDQAKANLQAVKQQQSAAEAGVQEAVAKRSNVAQSITAAQGRVTQAAGQEQAANTVGQVVSAKEAAAQQAKAKVEQARAALEQASLDLKRTRIYAPVSGFVNQTPIQVGAMVSPGTPLMAIVQSNTLYVDVNLKETQIADLKEGDEAEIDVDGFPAHAFKGHLVSLSPATGATFALLPPDNASGNFVKVVQRVPVRVGFDQGQPDLDKLRAGMSAYVSIKTK